MPQLRCWILHAHEYERDIERNKGKKSYSERDELLLTDMRNPYFNLAVDK